MAAHVHTSPSGAMPPHHGPPPAHQPNGHVVAQPKTLTQALAQMNEGAWLQIGKYLVKYGWQQELTIH